ncbi:DUF4871 domain-containing protein [Ammoniphilus sp. 3BR4]|uniref:DUF4871 domain-containing protein n=1 Tax=Ammoniphilus sp. 3BR4 TaxID=3158265 RepID=UPI0034650DEC
MKWLQMFIFIILLAGCGSEPPPEIDWKVSPTFQSGGQTMRGIEGHLALLEKPFKAGQRDEYDWHFWGSTAELAGKLTVIAVHQETSNTLTLIDRLFMVPVKPQNGADNSAHSVLSLPSSGLWRLDAYINGQMFGSVIVDVQE